MARVQEIVDGIPVLLVEAAEPGGDVVLWMSHLGGSAEQTLPMLERFAGAGHPAVSFDAVGHGGRGSGDPWEFAAGVLGAYRRRVWPILGQTTLEAMRVLTWAESEPGQRERPVPAASRWGATSPSRLPTSTAASGAWPPSAPRRTGRVQACVTCGTAPPTSTRVRPIRTHSGLPISSTRCATWSGTERVRRS